MSEKKQSPSRGWSILYSLGLLFILIGGVKVIQNIKIPMNLQPFIALASATLWFASALIFQKLPDETGKAKASQFFCLTIGLLQIIFAILIWTVDEPQLQIVMRLKFYNLGLCILCISVLYVALFQFSFPSLFHQTRPIPPQNPLAEFSQTTQDIINKGRNWITGAILGPILSFFFIGVVGIVVTDSIEFFLISTWSGFLIGFPMGIIVTYKWQSRARESGIPEDELKAAAKAAKLWWPKTKEE